LVHDPLELANVWQNQPSVQSTVRLDGKSVTCKSVTYRKKKKSFFDGTEEHRMKPNELSGDQLLHQLKNLTNVRFGKDEKGKSRKRKENELNWTKNSIFFFNFPYWSTLKLRNNLDVMHIEKNICDSVLGTSLNIDGKTNDTFKDDRICV